VQKPTYESRVVSGDTDGDGSAFDDLDEPSMVARATATEVLRAKDFALCTADELDEVHRLIGELRLHSALRRSRRTRPTARHRGRLELRATARRALATGGEPLRLARRERALVARRV